MLDIDGAGTTQAVKQRPESEVMQMEIPANPYAALRTPAVTTPMKQLVQEFEEFERRRNR